VRSRSNAWHDAICEQLRSADRPLGVDQIWEGLVATNFQHASAMPKSTLGARIAELVQRKKIARVGPATYQIFGESQQEARVHAAMTKKLTSEGAS
jgi:hypothetical protein